MVSDSLPPGLGMVKRKRGEQRETTEGEERTEEVATGVHPFHAAARQEAREVGETFWGVSSYGDGKECSLTPPAALAD